MMKFLLYAPIISIVIGIIVGLCVSSSSRGSKPDWDPRLPDGENKMKKEYPKNPSIASQIDGRLTNVFTNPWEGIL